MNDKYTINQAMRGHIISELFESDDPEYKNIRDRNRGDASIFSPINMNHTSESQKKLLNSMLSIIMYKEYIITKLERIVTEKISLKQITYKQSLKIKEEMQELVDLFPLEEEVGTALDKIDRKYENIISICLNGTKYSSDYSPAWFSVSKDEYIEESSSLKSERVCGIQKSCSIS